MPAGTTKDDLEWPWMPDSTQSALYGRHTVRTYVVAFGAGHAWLNEHGFNCQRDKCGQWTMISEHEVCTNFLRGLLQSRRRIIHSHYAASSLRYLEMCGRLLQRVSIACYAERCISHDRFCPTVRPSDRLSHAGIMSKRLQLRSCGLHWRIAPWL